MNDIQQEEDSAITAGQAGSCIEEWGAIGINSDLPLMMPANTLFLALADNPHHRPASASPHFTTWRACLREFWV